MAKQRIRKLAAAVAAVFITGGTALAQEAMNGNESIATAQPLQVSGNGTASVNGVIGLKTPDSAILDVDFYSFPAAAGAEVTILINGGIGGERNVDTVLYLFGPNGLQLPLPEGFNDDPEDGVVNPGSNDLRDARIKVTIPSDGTYTVAVTGVGVNINPDGSYPPTPVGENGDYTLVVSGLAVTNPGGSGGSAGGDGGGGQTVVEKIKIDVEPGERNNVVRDSERHVTVAVLSSESFNAMDVDPSSLRFGVKGDEASLSKCEPRGHRVDRNRSRDLVCHFRTRYAGFTAGNHDVVLTGKTRTGRAFEGRSTLKYVERRNRPAYRNGRGDD